MWEEIQTLEHLKIDLVNKSSEYHMCSIRSHFDTRVFYTANSQFSATANSVKKEQTQQKRARSKILSERARSKRALRAERAKNLQKSRMHSLSSTSYRFCFV